MTLKSIISILMSIFFNIFSAFNISEIEYEKPIMVKSLPLDIFFGPLRKIFLAVDNYYMCHEAIYVLEKLLGYYHN